jgi:hypothetical protein
MSVDVHNIFSCVSVFEGHHIDETTHGKFTDRNWLYSCSDNYQLLRIVVHVGSAVHRVPLGQGFFQELCFSLLLIVPPCSMLICHSELVQQVTVPRDSISPHYSWYSRSQYQGTQSHHTTAGTVGHSTKGLSLTTLQLLQTCIYSNVWNTYLLLELMHCHKTCQCSSSLNFDKDLVLQ